MALHLIKLSVGPDSLSDLEAWQQQRLAQLRCAGRVPQLMHTTRHMPKRAKEVLDGGSIYWVIKGWLCARQELVELRPIEIDGVPHCGLIYAPELIRVRPRKHRAFQGWRYFDPKDAPPDLIIDNGEMDVPEEMRRELAELGLL